MLALLIALFLAQATPTPLADAIVFRPGPAAPGATGWLDHDGRDATLSVDLPRTGDMAAYLLVGVINGKPEPLADLMVGPDGRGMVAFELDRPLTDYDALWVEPSDPDAILIEPGDGGDAVLTADPQLPMLCIDLNSDAPQRGEPVPCDGSLGATGSALEPMPGDRPDGATEDVPCYVIEDGDTDLPKDDILGPVCEIPQDPPPDSCVDLNSVELPDAHICEYAAG